MRRLLLAIAWMLIAFTVDFSAPAAQQPGRVYKIGWLWAGEPGLAPIPYAEFKGGGGIFRDTLRDRGFVEGKNLVVDVREAQGDVSRLSALAEALVATQPDLIVSPGTAPTVAAMRATKTIPIVFPGVGNPVERGIVKSLANHGGNATGMAVNISNPKMRQLLRDAAPTIRRLGIVTYAPNAFSNKPSAEYRAAAIATAIEVLAKEGFEFAEVYVDNLEELEAKVSALASRGDAALFMLTDSRLFTWRDKIVAMAMHHRMPTACAQWFGWGKAGCLITYGEDQDDISRRAAGLAVKILNGTKPADIPIEQPTKFKLIVNAKTARALDLVLPPSLLAMADEVIE